MSYAEKLKDVRWQRKRLELLEKSQWRCSNIQLGTCPNYETPDKNTLAVHHRIYLPKTEPWDYEAWAYQVLCDDCHKQAQLIMQQAQTALAKSEALMGACALLNELSMNELECFADFLVMSISIKPNIREAIVDLLPQLELLILSCFRAGMERQQIASSPPETQKPAEVQFMPVEEK